MFRGLSAFPITPADDQGHVDTDTLGTLLERLCTAGADSIGLLGSTGTYAYLSRDQRRRTVEAAVECVDGRVPLIVGAGALRTDEAMALARDAEEAGADGLLLAPMSYTPLISEEVYQHFVSVAGATGLPLCIYNNPSTTKFTFDSALIERLAKLANITAIKMPLPADGDFASEIARLRDVTSADFAIGYSGDWGAADALLAGCDSWFSVVGGTLPEPALALTRAAQTGNIEEAHRLDAEFAPLWSLFKEFGSLRVIYMMLDILGICRLEPPHPILLPPQEARVRVEKALAGLI